MNKFHERVAQLHIVQHVRKASQLLRCVHSLQNVLNAPETAEPQNCTKIKVIVVPYKVVCNKYTKTRSLPRQTNYTNLIQKSSIANVIMQESYS